MEINLHRFIIEEQGGDEGVWESASGMFLQEYSYKMQLNSLDLGNRFWKYLNVATILGLALISDGQKVY